MTVDSNGVSFGLPTGAPSGVPPDQGIPRAPSSNPETHLHRIVIPVSLVTLVQAQNVDAFQELVRLTYTPLVRFGRSIVASPDDAEDVVQDVFVALWNLGARWTPTGDPVAYLFASVRNHALNELRRRARTEHRAQRAYGLDTDVSGNADAYNRQQTLDAVVDAEDAAARVHRVSAILTMLPERQRTAYELRYRRGLTIAAIAEVLGTTVKSAEHLTARAARAVLDRLREIEAEVEVEAEMDTDTEIQE